MHKRIKKILLIFFVVIIASALSCGIYFLLKSLNITNIKSLREYISKFGAKSWIVYVGLQVLISTPIFVMPFEDELWTTLAILLFGAKLGCVLSIISMLIISSLLYLLGNKFGFSLAKKIVGENEIKSVQTKLEVKGKLSLPFLYFIPFFPHDLLCVVAGILKMKFWYFILVTALIRPIEILALCFLGGEFISWSSLTTFDWLLFINLVIIDIYLIKKLSVYMEKKLEEKNTQRNTKKDNIQN